MICMINLNSKLLIIKIKSILISIKNFLKQVLNVEVSFRMRFIKLNGSIVLLTCLKILCFNFINISWIQIDYQLMIFLYINTFIFKLFNGVSIVMLADAFLWEAWYSMILNKWCQYLVILIPLPIYQISHNQYDVLELCFIHTIFIF
jgi:hypothetical protein